MARIFFAFLSQLPSGSCFDPLPQPETEYELQKFFTEETGALVCANYHYVLRQKRQGNRATKPWGDL